MLTLPFHTILALFGLGLVISFSPMLIATHLLILAKARKQYLQSIILLFGMTTSLCTAVIVCNVVVSIPWLRSISEKSASQLQDSGIIWADIIAGIVCIVGAAIYAFISFRRKPKDIGDKLPDIDNIKTIYLLGLTRAILNFSSIAALYLAIRSAHKYVPHYEVTFFIGVLVIGVSLLPYIGFVVLHRLSPHNFKTIRKRFRKISSYDYRRSMSVVLVIVGIYLLISALAK